MDVGVASLLPVDRLADSESIDNRRFIAYVQMGALGEICLEWHQGVVAMQRDELVDHLVDLFARIAGSPPDRPDPDGPQTR